MTQEIKLREEVVDAKNHGARKFQHFTNNFYLLRAALRYYSKKNQMSFTTSRVAEDFPIPISVAGSGLSILEELEVIEPRTQASKKRYMPEKVDLKKLQEIQEILIESHEIDQFQQ